MEQPLQLIKDEPTTPPHLNTPTQIVTSPNIKERLNLHVKRRLQQDVLSGAMHGEHHQPPPQQPNNLHRIEPAPLAPLCKEGEMKELKQKQRRPYQKRADKLNQQTEGGEPPASVQRKYKRHKMKHTQLSLVSGSLAQGSNSDGALSEGGGAGGVSVAGEHNNIDDEGSQDDGAADADGRGANGTGRDKEKCPDVLGLVLSIKKRALMQDPEVREFLGRLMEAIKS